MIIVTLDATGLIGGDYVANLHILSNDPNNPDVSLNVTMHVIGAPIIHAEWPVAAGFPDSINFNAFLGELRESVPYGVPIKVINGGTDDLEVLDCAVDSPIFTVDPNQFIVVPGDTQAVTLNLFTDSLGVANAILTITSNAFNGPRDIPVHADVSLSVNDHPSLPLSLLLYPPSPNPFNSTTTLRFSLPTRELTRLAIYDQSGRLVERLMGGELESGEHRLTWQAGDKPASVYFCRMEAGGTVQTVKMMLVK